MSRRALILALWCAGGQAGTAELSPRDFAYVMPVSTSAPAAAYSLTLPLDVWRGSAYPDLRDIRVFNAGGAVVPYELRALPAATGSRSEDQALPLFPLPADARITLNGMRISVESRGTTIDVHTAAAKPAAAGTASYLIDARALTVPLDGFTLHWENGAADFTGSVRVEASDNLSAWRLIEAGAPIVSLTTGNAQLIQSRITFPSTQARFWRMTWAGGSAPIALSTVTADTAAAPPVQWLSVSVPPQSWDERRHEFAFDLGTRLPVEQVDVELPEANSAVRLQILSRPGGAEPWRAVTAAEFFRIQDGSGERRNEPLAVPPDSDRYWLVRLERSDAGLGPAQPKLRLAWKQRQLVFLARGSGPFLLAYGDAALEAATTPLDELLSRLALQPAELGAARVSGGPARRVPPPRTLPWRMLVLWSVLVAGVLLLGGMALRLSRELARTSGAP